ncbi:heavy metal-associated isoprenylated plant protein 47-like [Oryza brachyantha]|uniref:heavy metal-associated isoprenylated plant protein 47-like n=1 Tax=Oryza brachyantha TaxID=4533 RepID=UPI001ADC5BC1|nr:heavy metal-associated isoprenylated plant protein 47-like [Oryza brachyantha]
MKQKIEIKLCVPCEGCRTKALEVAARADGVISLAIAGGDKDRLEVVGVGVDVTGLVVSLRKKICHAEILKVEEVKEKEEEKKKPEAKPCCPRPYYCYAPPEAPPSCKPCCHPPPYCYPPPVVVCEEPSAACSIM